MHGSGRTTDLSQWLNDSPSNTHNYPETEVDLRLTLGAKILPEKL